VIGCYRFTLLLLFKFEIKQNVSNTNIVTNNIINGFKIILMAEPMIWKTTNFDKFVKHYEVGQISINLLFVHKRCHITSWTNFDKFVGCIIKGHHNLRCQDWFITPTTNFDKFVVQAKKMTYYIHDKFRQICSKQSSEWTNFGKFVKN